MKTIRLGAPEGGDTSDSYHYNMKKKWTELQHFTKTLAMYPLSIRRAFRNERG